MTALSMATYPPEVYAALSLAAKHWHKAGYNRCGRFRCGSKWHEAKAMKLESRARRLAAKRGLTIEARISL